MKLSWKKIKDMLCDNIALKAVSVIMAIALWLLVINIDDPQVTTTIKGIPVKILNDNAVTDNNDAYDVLSGNTIDIKVTGPRTIVDSLKEDDFTATADFRDLSKTDAVPINVSVNNTRYESKITITSKSEDAMRLSVMALVEKEYPVEIKKSGDVMQGYVLYDAVPENGSTTVIVKAPEEIHKSIVKVAAGLVLSGSEDSDFTRICGIMAYDFSGKAFDSQKSHITFSMQNVNVHGKVLYTKMVPVEYKVINRFSAGVVLTEYKASMESVNIAGNKEIIEQIAELKIPEEMTVFTDGMTEISVELKDILPEGVYIYGSDSIFKITAETENTVVKTVSIAVGDIGIRKIPDGYEASISDTGVINIIISGRQEELEQINAENLAPYVDLTNAEEGENNIRVNIMLPDGMIEMEAVYVTVVLTDKNHGQESTTEEETSDDTTTEPDTDDGGSGGEEDTTPEEEARVTPDT